MASQISTVARLLETKYEVSSFLSKDLNDLKQFGLGSLCPTMSDMMATMKTLVEQATNFRCYTKGSSIIYSGKKGAKKNAKVDDLVMAIVIAVAWARLPQNIYVLE